MHKFVTALVLAAIMLVPSTTMAQNTNSVPVPPTTSARDNSKVDKAIHLDLYTDFNTATDRNRAYGNLNQEQFVFSYSPFNTNKSTVFAGLGKAQLFGNNQEFYDVPARYSLTTWEVGSQYTFTNRFDVTASYGFVPNNGITFANDPRGYHQFEIDGHYRAF